MSQSLFSTLTDLPCREFAAPAGTHVFLRDDPVDRIFLLREGQVRLIRYQKDGMAVLLHHATRPTILAEASLYAARYHCDCEITKNSLLTAIDRTLVLGLLENRPALHAEWAAHLARSLQDTRQRCEILTRKTVGSRLDGWLDGRPLPKKGSWKDIAAELGVSPEALYREIAKRRTAYHS